MLFGTENPDFQSFKTSMFTAMRIILGDFDYLALERTNRILGPIYFILYIFFVFFILLNMFLAIVNDTYSEVKAEKITSTNFQDWFRVKFQKLIDCVWCGKIKTNTGIDEKVDQLVDDEKIDDNLNMNNNEEFKRIFDDLKRKYDVELTKLDNRVYTLEKSIEGIITQMDRLIAKLEMLRRIENN